MRTLLVILCCLSGVAGAFGQEDRVRAGSAYGSNVFFELAGNGGVFSINYDMRFKRQNHGLGARVGIGVVPSVNFGIGSTSSITTVPVGLNYLTGARSHHLELGFGTTLITGKVSLFDMEESGTTFLFIPSIGYRYQPDHRGFTGRLILSPIISGAGSVFFAGVSAGFRI